VKRGTAIATFDKNHRYPKDKRGAPAIPGRKNSAIFLATVMDGIYVVDQFPHNQDGSEHPAAPRKIRYAPSALPANNAAAYSVILCKE
jgi:hypothetical protein